MSKLPPIVKSKGSFRIWCSYMMLSVNQAAALLKISTPTIYKNIKEESENEALRGPLALCCNLISEKQFESRAAWIKKTLHQNGCDEHWPSLEPITKNQDRN